MTQNTLQAENWDIGKDRARMSFLGRMIEGNYFYFLSAALMLLAVYKLMPTTVIELEGDEFAPTLKSLLILQGYEVLVIFTAIFIVHRLKVLDDAFLLLLIELVLILDPTFFSNSFISMRSLESLMVNIVCFGLVPLKLYVLQKGLKLRIAPGAWAALLFTALYVYLAEGPLMQRIPLYIFCEAEYFYLLSWGPLVFAAILPALGTLVTVTSEKEGYMSDKRRNLLNGLLLCLPLFVIMAHQIESAHVQVVPFFLRSLAPLVLATAVLVIRNRRSLSFWRVTAMVDVLAVVAVVLSAFAWKMPGFIERDVDLSGVVHPLVPIVLCGLAVIGIYFYLFMATRYRQALFRVIALALISGGWFLFQQEAVRHFLNTSREQVAAGVNGAYTGTGNALAWIKNQIAGMAHWSLDNFGLLLIMFSLGLLALAIRKRSLGTWFTFGVTAIWAAFYNTPQGAGHWLPEVIQCIAVYGLIVMHAFKAVEKKNGCYSLAVLVVYIGLIRFYIQPTFFGGVLIMAEFLLLIGGGIYLRYPGYLLVGLFQALIIFIYRFNYFKKYLDTGGFFLSAALVIFAVGIFVTFNKRRIIDRLGRYMEGSVHCDLTAELIKEDDPEL